MVSWLLVAPMVIILIRLRWVDMGIDKKVWLFTDNDGQLKSRSEYLSSDKYWTDRLRQIDTNQMILLAVLFGPMWILLIGAFITGGYK